MLKKNIGFRGWVYFRIGWSLYLAFIFAAINTLTVTYFLAIENFTMLKDIFPTFQHYVVILVAIGVPILVLIGYIHYKKSDAYKSEADIFIESNPHSRRLLLNTETQLGLSLELLNLILKISNDEKISEADKKTILKLKVDLTTYMTERSVSASKMPTIFDDKK
jgi:hypothetical protein